MINLIKNKNNSLPQQVNENKLNIELLNKVVIIPNYRANWTINETYNIWDIVYNVENGENIGYICVKNIENSGIIDITNTNYWLRITSEKGEQGIQGIQGIQGEKGEKGDPGHPVYAGTWVSTTTYKPNDVVTYTRPGKIETIAYQCLRENTNIIPYDALEDWVQLTGFNGNNGQTPYISHVYVEYTATNVSPYASVSGNINDLTITFYLPITNINIYNDGTTGDTTSVYSTLFLNNVVTLIQHYINKTYSKVVTPLSNDITDIYNEYLVHFVGNYSVSVPVNTLKKITYLVNINGNYTTFSIDFNNYYPDNTINEYHSVKQVSTSQYYIVIDTKGNRTNNNAIEFELNITVYDRSTNLPVSSIPSNSYIKEIEIITETKQNMNLFGQ